MMGSKDELGEFNFGALFGALIGTTVTVLIFTFPTEQSKTWVYSYQTLIAAGLAVVAAAISSVLIRRQIQQQSEIENARRAREQAAAKPLLSFALVKLLDYSDSCFHQLKQLSQPLLENEQSFIERPCNFEVPALPNEIFDALEKNLLFGHPSVVEVLSMLLAKLQIQNSRIVGIMQPRHRDFDSGRIIQENVFQYMADSLEISTLAIRLFPYSRGEAIEVEKAITFGNLFQAGTLAVDFESQDPFVLFLMRKYPRE